MKIINPRGLIKIVWSIEFVLKGLSRTIIIFFYCFFVEQFENGKVFIDDDTVCSVMTYCIVVYKLI